MTDTDTLLRSETCQTNNTESKFIHDLRLAGGDLVQVARGSHTEARDGRPQLPEVPSGSQLAKGLCFYEDIPDRTAKQDAREDLRYNVTMCECHVFQIECQTKLPNRKLDTIQEQDASDRMPAKMSTCLPSRTSDRMVGQDSRCIVRQTARIFVR